jgi:hypothetical protein
MIKTPVILIVIAAGLFSCGTTKKSARNNPSYNKQQAELMDERTFKLTEVSDDGSYGYTEKNPIKVGGAKKSEGPLNERRFLNALQGPNGGRISYVRKGSCCTFETPNGIMGGGLLDVYEVKYDGLEKPIVLYINMYDYGILKAPKGFTYRSIAIKG